MEQINTVNQFSINDIASSGVKKVRTSDSKFSDVMSASSRTSQNEERVNRTVDKGSASNSFKTSKSSIKRFEQPDIQMKKNVTRSLNINLSDVIEEASNLIDGFKEKIADTLGVSKEELEEIMAELGFNTMDLLNVNTLKDLVLQVNGLTEASELLTNETVCNQLDDLLETVDSFVQSVDMEQFTKAVLIKDSKDFGTVLDEVDAENHVVVDQEDSNYEEPMITVQKEVSSDSDESSKGNDSKNQDKNVESQFNQFVQNLSESTQGVDNVSTSHFDRLQQMQEIVDQVVEKIKVTISSDTTSMELQLNPEHLGKVNLSIISKHGQLTASFVVENHMAKEALESQLSLLRDNLNEQGIKIEAVEVTVAEQGFSQNDFMNQGQGSFHEQAKRSNSTGKIRLEDDLIEEVEEEAVSINEGSGTVDFSA